MSPAVRAALLGLSAVAVAHVALFGMWVVDDAAISFAYARHWADGQGLVPFVGGERVEGYSNFAWVVLLAFGEVLGLGALLTAKAAAMALTAGTVPLVYRLGARAAPSAPVAAGLAAATVFALDPQVAIFGAAGLENPLFSFLLALGLVLADDEAEQGTRPWSALAFLGVALCRPEGPLYAGLAALLVGLATARAGRGWRPLAAWLVLFLAPFAAYHAARYAYFAWPFPMTYYAKVRHGPGEMLEWGSEGWLYLRSFVADLHRGWFLPLIVLGRVGSARWRWAAAAVAVGVVLWLIPVDLVRAVGWLALGVGLGLPGLLAADAAGRVRSACWGMGLLSVLFALYAQGDWMGAYRWLSFAAAPAAVLLGAGLAELGALAGGRAGWVAAAATGALGLGLGWWNLDYSRSFLDNLEVSPYDIRHRVARNAERAARLHLDERARVLVVDLGGFLWWSAMETVDYVGLTDVAFGQGADRRPTVARQYLLEEARPHLLQLPRHMTRPLRTLDGYADVYIDLNPEVSVRRDLLFTRGWADPEEAVRYDRGVTLAGIDVPSPEVPAGGPLYVEVGLLGDPDVTLGARLLLADAAGVAVASWPIQVGYGWTSIHPEDVLVGRYSLALPASLPEGRYTLGIRLSGDGEVLLPVSADRGGEAPGDGVREGDPEAGGEGTGEVRWLDGAVEVVAEEAAAAAADADRARAIRIAQGERCEDAATAWRDARLHLPADPGFADRHRAEVHRALATCWIARADAEPATAVAALESARRLDPDAPGLADRAGALADRLYAEGMTLRAERRWRKAHQAFADVVRLDPSRSWARQRSEQTRGLMLDVAERKEQRDRD